MFPHYMPFAPGNEYVLKMCFFVFPANRVQQLIFRRHRQHGHVFALKQSNFENEAKKTRMRKSTTNNQARIKTSKKHIENGREKDTRDITRLIKPTKELNITST